MNLRKPQWSGWMEVGAGKLQSIIGALQLVAFTSTVAGIIFAYFGSAEWPNVSKWAIVFLGIALLSWGVASLTRSVLKDQPPVFINPSLWVERDEVTIKVHANHREVRRRYEFKARRKVERYRFKFRWSGSENVKVTLEGTDDALIRITSPKVQKSWHRYEVRFAETLRAGEKKTVILHYDLPDRANESEPYHLISYAHVAGCSHLIARLSFPDNEVPRDVYLIHYDADWVVQKGLPIGYDADDHEYRIEIEPEAGIKYSLEWQEK